MILSLDLKKRVITGVNLFRYVLEGLHVNTMTVPLKGYRHIGSWNGKNTTQHCFKQ